MTEQKDAIERLVDEMFHETKMEGGYRKQEALYEIIRIQHEALKTIGHIVWGQGEASIDQVCANQAMIKVNEVAKEILGDE